MSTSRAALTATSSSASDGSKLGKATPVKARWAWIGARQRLRIRQQCNLVLYVSQLSACAWPGQSHHGELKEKITQQRWKCAGVEWIECAQRRFGLCTLLKGSGGPGLEHAR